MPAYTAKLKNQYFFNMHIAQANHILGPAKNNVLDFTMQHAKMIKGQWVGDN